MTTATDDATGDGAPSELSTDDLSQYLDEVLTDGQQPGAADADRRGTSPEPAGPDDSAQPDAPELFTVKVNGEERRIDRDELLRGYQSAQSSSQRFEEAAALRRTAEAAHGAALEQQQRLGQVLNAYEQGLAQLVQFGQPDPNLINTDPVEYLRQKQVHEARAAEWNRVRNDQALLAQQQQQIEQARYQEYLQDQVRSLREKIPEWKDPKTAERGFGDVVGYLRGEGFNEAELAHVVDHRQIAIARKAMLFDKLLAARDGATKRVKDLPPARVERPGATRGADGRYRKTQSLPDTLTTDQAGEILAAMLAGD